MLRKSPGKTGKRKRPIIALIWPCGLALAIAGLALPGCHKPAKVDSAAASVEPARDAALPHASYAQIEGEYERLKVDVVRAIQRSHWALLHLDAPPDAPMYPPATLPEKESDRPAWARRTPITADALLPDGRQARVIAWEGEPKHVAVMIRVGAFGNPADEQFYVNQLASTLADKPKPKRGGKFELP